MVKVIMHGCNGRMGQVIAGIIREDADVQIVAGVDVVDNIDNGFPVFSTIFDCDVEADVIIDFASIKAIEGLIDYSVGKQIPVVVCTTGLMPEQMNKLMDASDEVAVLRSANMSLGVNMLLKLLQEAALVLAPEGFDIEIVEKHHRLKVDAPSGTALAMADSINQVLNNEYTYSYDRSQVRKKRDDKVIGIQAVRGGTIVGDHEVIFAGNDEVIEFRHTAYSKAIFAKGAVAAAKFLAGKPAGLYDMSHVIGS